MDVAHAENPRWQASTRKNYGKGLAYARVDDKDVLYLITPATTWSPSTLTQGRPLVRLASMGLLTFI